MPDDQNQPTPAPAPTKEPLKTQKQPGQGRPEYTDEQYAAWLSEMRPFLEKGNSINYACDKAGILSHAFVIYEKYKLNDWFSKKVDLYRARPGELINDTLTTLVYTIMDKIKREQPVTDKELDMLKFMAEKHRTAQPFFVNRTETAQVDESKVGKILDTMEETDYGDVGRQAEKQMVEVNPPVQDKGQVGPDSNL